MCVHHTTLCYTCIFTGSFTPGPYSPFDLSKVSQPSSQTEADDPTTATTTATTATSATGGAPMQYSSSSIGSSNSPDQTQQQQQQLSQDSGTVQQYSLNSCDYSSSISTQTLVFPPLSPDAFTDFSRHDPDAIQRNM
jgi:hypothetical protein